MTISTLFSLRRGFLSCAVALLSFGMVHAENTTIEVGQQPVAIFPIGNVVHVFHSQVDANFNGTQDEGDSPASWWTLNPVTRQVLAKKEFEWGGIGFPFRPYIDAETKTIYLSQTGRILALSLETQEVVEDVVASYAASGIAVDGDIVYASVRPNYTDPGFLMRYDRQTQQETKTTVGVNPQQVVRFASDSQEGVLVLCEGGFGTGSAPSALYKQFADGTTVETALELGGTGNHIVVQGNYAFVSMNGSSEIKIVDIANWEVVNSIAVATGVGDGPREVAVLDGDIFVSTYAGDVRRYSATTGALKATLKTTGKPEGIAVVGNSLWIANAYQAGSFTVSNVIDVWNFAATSVAEAHGGNRVVLSPSVVLDEAEVVVPTAFLAGDVRGTIVSATGREVAVVSFSPSDSGEQRARLSVSHLGLASGRYFLRVVGNAKAAVVPFVVVR